MTLPLVPGLKTHECERNRRTSQSRLFKHLEDGLENSDVKKHENKGTYALMSLSKKIK